MQAYDPEPSACLVLDVRMDGMSGIELHDELLRRGRGSAPDLHDRTRRRADGGRADETWAPSIFSRSRSTTSSCAAPSRCALQQAAERTRDGHRQRERNQTLLARLTPRERQVLDLIATGRLNKQIADDLSISIKTVEAHRANIMEKFEVRTMADLMRRYLNARAAS